GCRSESRCRLQHRRMRRWWALREEPPAARQLAPTPPRQRSRRWKRNDACRNSWGEGYASKPLTHSPTKYPATATPRPTTNISSPDRNTLRPVNTDRAAPTIQGDNIAMTNDRSITVSPGQEEHGKP